MRGVHYFIRLTAPLSRVQADYLEAIPGVQAIKTGTGGLHPFIKAPLHAGWLVEAELQRWGAVRDQHYSIKIDAKTPFGLTPDQLVVAPEDIKELRDEVPGILFSFQRQGLQFFQERLGGLAKWPCLAGDAELVCNRAGHGFRIRLDELVRKLAGGVSRGGKQWDLTIPTRIRCVDVDGTVISGEILRAFASGEKEVFEVVVERADGECRSLKATLDHRFCQPKPGAPAGTRLGDLELGDYTLVVGARSGRPQAVPARVISIESKGIQPTFDVMLAQEPHQYVANDFVVHNCGSGKTLLGILWSLSYQPPGGVRPRTLIVTRAATTFQWRAQFETFTKPGAVKVAVLSGENAFEAKASPSQAETHWVELNPGFTYESALAAYAEAGHKRTARVRETLEDLDNTHRPLDRASLPAAAKQVIVKLAWVGAVRTWTEVDPDWRPWRTVNKITGEIVQQFGGDATVFLLPEERDTLVQHLDDGRGPGKKAQWIRAAILIYRHDQDLSLPVIAQKLDISLEEVHEIIGKWAARRSAKAGHSGAQIPPDVDVAVIGWPVLTAWLPILLKWEPESVVLDESHTGKSPKRWSAIPKPDGNMRFVPKSNVSASAMQITRRKTHRVLALSATPQPDRNRDWWAQLDNLAPYQWNQFQAFSLRYCAAYENEWGWDTSGSSNEAELNQRLSFVVHSVSKEEYRAEVPELRRSLVVLTAAELVSVKPSRGEFAEARGNGHSAMLEYKLALTAGMKRPYVMKRVEEAVEDGWKVVIFTGRRKDCDRLGKQIATLAKRLNKLKRYSARGRVIRTWATHGKTPRVERLAALAEYVQCEGPAVFVGTLDAWGEGIDGFQYTHLALITMLPWNHGKLVQTEGRFDRLTLGAEAYSTIVEYVIAAGTVDEEMQDRILTKGSSAAEVLDDADLRELTADLGASSTDDETLLDALAAKLLAAHKKRREVE